LDNRNNLSYRLSIYFLTAAILLSGVTILIGYFYTRNLMIESNRYRLQFEVREVLDDVENSMDNAERFTRHLALDFNQEHINKDPFKFMTLIFESQPDTYAIAMVTSEADKPAPLSSNFTLYRSGGIIKLDTGKIFSKNEKTNEWINQMLHNSRPQWSAPFFDPKIGSRAIIFSYPFDYKVSNRLVHATFFCSVALDNNLRNLSNHKLIQTGFAVLVNEQNQIVYYQDNSKTGQNVNLVLESLEKDQPAFGKWIKERNSGFQFMHLPIIKDWWAIVISWTMKSSDWYIFIVVPENLFISELKRIILLLIPLILFIGSVAAAITISNSIKLLSPIYLLAKDSHQIVENVDFNSDDSAYDSINDSESKTTRRFYRKNSSLPLKNIEALSHNMEKIKVRLDNYRQNTLRTTIDKEVMDKELNLARDIEMRMVPTNFPLLPGRNDFDCFGRLIPAKIVGGDLFDIFLVYENQLFISILDTVGKGIPAAMYSVMIMTFIRSITNSINNVDKVKESLNNALGLTNKSSSLGKMMESLNDALGLLRDVDMFATVFLGRLNLETGEFTYCNAGHLHPVILRNDHHEEVLSQSHGIPLGVKSNLQFSESKTILASGESVITFTDGVTEQCNDKGEFFGMERLISLVYSMQELTTEEIVNKTLEALENFRGETDVHDDIAIAAIKFLGR